MIKRTIFAIGALALCFLLSKAIAMDTAPTGLPSAQPDPIKTTAGVLYAELFSRERQADVRTLIVVLHGDAPSGFTDYQYGVAERASAMIEHSAVVAILRPGYADREGHRSDGDPGSTVGDSYTADRIDTVAAAIGVLKTQFPHAKVIVAGHSGGAAVTANLAGTHPGLFDGMLLVSCPCNVPLWHEHMKSLVAADSWLPHIESLDPMTTIAHVAPRLKVAMVVGDKDNVTPPTLSRAYAAALAKRHVRTGVQLVPGGDHNVFSTDQVLAALMALSAGLEPTP